MGRVSGRLVLLALALAALGILVLPSTVSLFAGEHIWYEEEELPCQKCHADIAAELESAENHAHKSWGAAPAPCYGCHKVTQATVPFNMSAYKTDYNEYYMGEPNATIGKHAATLVDCEACHRVGWLDYWTNDPHYEFVNNSTQSTLLPNATEACVGCHTHARVEINFTWAKYFKFTAQVNDSADRSRVYGTNVGYYLWFVNSSNFTTNGTELHWIFEESAYVWNGSAFVPYNGTNMP